VLRLGGLEVQLASLPSAEYLAELARLVGG
jgi:hypothetical protein